jgi:hypothetical protein
LAEGCWLSASAGYLPLMSKRVLSVLPAVAFLVLAGLTVADHRPLLVSACFAGVALLFVIGAVARWRGPG